VTVSIGVCDLTSGIEVQTLYKRADQALYLAKEHGRNRAYRYSAEVLV
jgi:PleD family two-component response regulator